MRRLSYFAVVLLFTGNLFAQTLDDVGRMSINVQRPVNRNIPTEALDQLDDKMHQIITTAGISDNAINRRFALTATVSVVKKDIISGSPARVSQTLEIAFYVKDVIDRKEDVPAQRLVLVAVGEDFYLGVRVDCSNDIRSRLDLCPTDVLLNEHLVDEVVCFDIIEVV